MIRNWRIGAAINPLPMSTPAISPSSRTLCDIATTYELPARDICAPSAPLPTRGAERVVRGVPNVGLALEAPRVGAVADRLTADKLHGRVLDMRTGELVDQETFYQRIREARVIYISETHDNPAHHALQQRILERLDADNARVTMAMEFLYRSRQPVIDAYLRGAIDEQTFETQVRDGFGSLYAQYRDLIHTARANGNRIVGMNVEREIKHKYLDQGWERLTPDEQRLIARELDLSNPAYRAYLRRVIEESHGSLEGLPEPMLERFMRLQAIWDETFAETIANVVRDDPETKVLVIVGNAHVREKLNVPEKSYRRAAAPYVTLVPIEARPNQPLDLDAIRRSAIADYVFFSDVPAGR